MRLAARRALSLALPLAAGLLALAYLALLWSLDALPLGDLPNHLARATISADLLFHGGQRFGLGYQLHLAPVPYVLGDVALAGLVEWLGPYGAGRLWACLVAAAPPAAAAVYLRLVGFTPRGVLLGALLSLYLSTDWFFVNGFGHYRLAIALTLLATAAWQRFLRGGAPLAWACYAALLLAGYLMHLSALLFSGMSAVVTAAVALHFRETSARRAASGALPFGALGIWHLYASGPNPGGGRLFLLSPARKALAAASPFLRYDLASEGALLLVFLLACALLARGLGAARRDPRAVTFAALCLASLALYAVLPHSRGSVAYVDVRAIPFAALFAVFGALAVAERRASPPRLAAALAVALAAGNLALLAAHLRPANAEMRAYRALAATVPTGAVVLPVATRPRDGRSNPFLHAGTLATIEAGASTPYLFAGGVTTYFRALDRPRAPSEFWYQEGGDAGDAATLARTYAFCLVMVPFDASRLPVRTEEVARNGSAALLAVVR
ncbi:MAG TPA: hypothetical protein VFE30_02260 [Anaeromyxobacteraceae bacterium]|jgi:hypothetical protein|nr:hypothetical protein [Anaeromyxobacteraceae bacterium]